MPNYWNLSNELNDNTDMYEPCNNIMDALEVYTYISEYLMKEIKLVTRFRSRETTLLADNREETIPRKNNVIEQFFCELKRDIRRVCGNIATGDMLANNGVSLVIF